METQAPEPALRISVVIPCLNAASTIRLQLDALANQKCDFPWEVIVADNGSTDDTMTIVKSYHDLLPNLRVINASQEKGASYSRNLGAQMAQGEYLVFLDSDDEVNSEYLTGMSDALSLYDFVAAAMEYCKLNEPWVQKTRPWYQFAGYIAEFASIPTAAGCSMGIKRSIHTAIGGFNSAMDASEDDDYCWRVRQTGTTLHFVPKAVVHYRLRHNFKDMYRQYYAYGKSEMLLYKKSQPDWYPRISLLYFLKIYAGFLFHLSRSFWSKKHFGIFVIKLGYVLGRTNGFFLQK